MIKTFENFINESKNYNLYKGMSYSSEKSYHFYMIFPNYSHTI
jgi:hypothetical protein